MNNRLSDYSVDQLERLRAAMVSIANLDWENMNNMQNMKTIMEKNSTWYFTNDKTKGKGESEKTFRLADYPSDSEIESLKERVNDLKYEFTDIPVNVQTYLASLE